MEILANMLIPYPWFMLIEQIHAVLIWSYYPMALEEPINKYLVKITTIKFA